MVLEMNAILSCYVQLYYKFEKKQQLHSSIIGHWKVPANYSELLSCRNEAVINPLSNFFYIINKRDNPQAGW